MRSSIRGTRVINNGYEAPKYYFHLNKIYSNFRVNKIIDEDCSNIIQSYCNNYDKVNAKLAFFMEDIQYTTRNSFCKGAAVKLKNFKKEATLSVLLTFTNSFLYDTLNELMDKIVPAGIPQYLIKYHEFNMFKVFVPADLSPVRILTIQDLEYGFVIWLGACGISFVGFLMEFLFIYSILLIKNLIGLWILLKSINSDLKFIGLK